MKLRTASKRANGRRRRGRGTSIWSILTGRWGRQHRLPAHVTGESDWEVEVPQIRMSRAFAVMLVLHVVAVGGLFAFRIWGRDDKEKSGSAAGDSGLSAALVEPAAAVNAAVASAAGEEAPVPAEPLKTYVMHTGDTLPLVAARFGVSVTALREANPDKLMLPGEEVVIPRSGRVIGGPVTGETAETSAEIFDPSGAEPVEGPPPPRAVVVPELSTLSEIPDVVPAHADESAAPLLQKVTARPAVKTETPRAGPSKAGDAVPLKKKAVVAESAVQPARTAGQRTHVVTKGDTVFNIAKRYGFSAEEVAKANGLDSSYRIRMGQQLRIPVKR